MHEYHCDIIVVGAGPAGSMAAKTAAKKGVEVILVEEHESPGTPVYCAEGLSLGGIRDAGLKPTPGIVSQEITKAHVLSPGKKIIELTNEDWSGYTLNRKIFDKTLAENAIKSGAKLLTNTTVKSVIINEKTIVGVKGVKDNEDFSIYAKIVIGADGHASIVRRSAGLNRWFPDVVTCAQYQLSGLELEKPNVNEFWMGRKYAPGGYAWVFPKSKHVANVGLGVRKIHDKPPIEYLNEFIKQDPRFKNAKIEEVSGGICPVSGPLDKIVDDGLMLVGDAAGLLIPMTGAGIHSGIESGKIAGKVAVEAINENDVSSERLSEYVTEFDKYWGKRIKESRKVLEMLDKFDDDDLDTLADVITNDDIISLANGTNVPGTIAGLIARSPIKILRLIRAYLR